MQDVYLMSPTHWAAKAWLSANPQPKEVKVHVVTNILRMRGVSNNARVLYIAPFNRVNYQPAFELGELQTRFPNVKVIHADRQ